MIFMPLSQFVAIWLISEMHSIVLIAETVLKWLDLKFIMDLPSCIRGGGSYLTLVRPEGIAKTRNGMKQEVT